MGTAAHPLGFRPPPPLRGRVRRCSAGSGTLAWRETRLEDLGVTLAWGRAAFADRAAREQATLGGLLAPEEVASLNRIRHPVSRSHFLAGRALRRAALARFLSVPPERLRFAADRFGRPHLAPGSAPGAVDFSVSHSGGFVIISISSERRVGIDLECVSHCDATPTLREMVLHPQERRELDPSCENDLREGFCCYWTLKEALLKAVGCGLVGRLADIRFRGAGGAPVRLLTSGAVDAGPAADWRFLRFSLDRRHRGALAARRALRS